jgi:hypothetical protein
VTQKPSGLVDKMLMLQMLYPAKNTREELFTTRLLQRLPEYYVQQADSPPWIWGSRQREQAEVGPPQAWF